MARDGGFVPTTGAGRPSILPTPDESDSKQVTLQDALAMNRAQVEKSKSAFDVGPPVRASNTPLTPPADNEFEEQELLLEELAAHCGCSVTEIDDYYPCTPLQEGMMAATSKDPTAYTIEHEYRLPSSMDPERLHEAWEKTAEANPILRTRIVTTTDHGSLQVVIRGSIQWEVRSDCDEGIHKAAGSIAWTEGAPLVRWTLDVSQRTLQMVIHHSLCDHWSVALLLRQVDAAYRGESLVNRPFRPLVDYVEGTRSQAETFWKQQFEDAPSSEMKIFPSLPSSNINPRPTHKVERIFDINPGSNASVAINTKLRLAWAVLQSVYTNTCDTLFGAVDAGRSVPVSGIQELIGPAIATVPVRIQLCGEDTVSTALSKVQAHWAQTMEFAHVGLQSLLRLGPGPKLACQFQTLLSVEPTDGHQLPALFSHNSSVQKSHNLYSCVLRCRPSAQSLSIEADFDPEVLEVLQTERLLSQFMHIYSQVDGHPEMTVAEIDAISPQDLEELACQNIPIGNQVPPPCVHELIQQRAAQQPAAIAVSSWDGVLSYQALDDLSSKLAHGLSHYSIQPGMFVPLCIEKSKWMAVAMMAVMKSGGAFVLLDSSHPTSRLWQMCETVQATIVVASRNKTELVSKLGVENIIIADEETAAQDLPASASSVTANHPIYATFTSGSTGTPKGVVVHHAGYASSALAHGAPYHISRESRVLQFASPAFDSCIIEHLTTLIFGGCVCVPSAAECHSHLEDVINRFDVTVACLTPTVTRILSPDRLRALKVLVFVGEAVLASDVSRWEPFVQVGNAYGPAECSAVFSVQPHLQLQDPANIGFATGGVGWVVHPEDHRRLMPLGSAGELLIEGEAVGNGYISNPEQTVKVFVDAPPWRRLLGPAPTRRMYKTGDLVQCIGDGGFRYLGRKDTQVKIHGQRLELGGVEHHLGNVFPQARQAVAEILRTSPGQGNEDHRPDAVLVAFICIPSSSATDHNTQSIFIQPSDDFREACTKAESKLLDIVPSFMVPKVFLPVSRVPLTASGKTDRRQLREQAGLLSWEQMQAYQAVRASRQLPASSEEEKLLEIWAHTLNRSIHQIGVTDNFFRLGGDSVVAMQVASRCQTMGCPVTVRDIFRYPTIRKLSERAHEEGNSQAVSWSAEDDPIDTWFELSPIQKMLFDHAPSGNNGFTQEFLLRVATPISISTLRNAMETILKRHSMLRARFEQQPDRQWMQIVRSHASSACSIRKHSLQTLEGGNGLRQILETARDLLDIRRGPLLVVDLIDTDDHAQYIGLMGHHLVVDLVSWRVILQDLEDILSTGNPSEPASMSFQQWCRLQRSYAKDELDPTASLPHAIPHPPLSYWGPEAVANNTWTDAVQESITVSQTATEAIFEQANDAFHTRPVELIQAAMLYAFVQVFDDREAPTIFNEGHGREPWSNIDISRTVGWFTTMAPLFIDARKGQNLHELIQLTKDGRRAIPSNGFPYFSTRYLHPDGQKLYNGHAPMEILFNYTGRFQQLERKDALLQLAAVPDHDMLPMPADLPRFAMIDVSASLIDGSLSLTFMYNRAMSHVDRLEKWFQTCLDTLEELPWQLEHERQMTISDFPLMSLSSEDHLQGLLHGVTSQCDVGVSQIEDIYPCSPIQLGMWLSQVKNTGRSYWSRIRWIFQTKDITSPSIQLSRVQDAWQQVVSRNPILRTVLVDGVCDNKYPVQVVLKSVNADTVVASKADVLAGDAAKRTYPDKKGRPPHQLLLSTNPDGTISCELTIHHVLVDGVTRQHLLSEVYDAYVGELDDTSAVPYSSYIEYLNERKGHAPETYWTEYLEGVQPCLFPALHDTGASQGSCTLRSTPFHYEIGPQLQSFCQDNGVLSSSVFQVAWGMALKTYTGQESVSFGYLASGRDIPLGGASSIAGPLTNLLLCRLCLLDDDGILSSITKNQTAYASGIENQGVSMPEVMHALGLSGQPLVNTAMSIQNQGADEISRKESDIVIKADGGYDSTEYDLILSITTSKEGIHGDITFWSNVIGDVQAELVLDTFHHLLLQLLDSTNKRIGDLDTLGARNREHLFENNRNLPAEVTRCVHSVIYDQSIVRPHAPAVAAWDIGLSYEELQDISSSWAECLLQNGVGPDVFVPICYEKSGWIVVAVLAVLKAGGAFILLDPSHPADRLRSMVRENFDCPVIITSAAHTELAATIVPKAIVIDSRGDEGYSEFPAPRKPTSNATPSSAVYAIFTSGTTGKPKASVIEHKSFSSGAKYHGPSLRINDDSRVLQFASVAFDASIVEILTTLLGGGCICIPSEDDRQGRLGDFIDEQQVSWALLTPSVARILDPKKLPTLETLVLGGEGMNADDVRRWQSHVVLINAYGPSECSVIAAVQPNSKVLSNEWSNIGWPTGGAFWVVGPGETSQPLPVGAVGELLIEGPIVGRGYVNRPEATAASFISSPSWLCNLRGHEGLLYRTSDLVRQLPDGSLRYIGRRDRQVKLRGLRIELSEVEFHVQRCFPKRDVEVFVDLVTHERDNKAHLVASVVHPLASSHSNAFHTAVSQTKVRMTREVPKYFVPSVFVQLTDLPRLVNGKTDRLLIQHGAAKALQCQMDQPDGQHKVWKAAELTEEERNMQNLWSDVLQCPKECIGPDSNFFQIGGDSITAMRLASAAGAIGLNLAVPQVFLHPELRELALIASSPREEAVSTEDLASEVGAKISGTAFSLLPAEYQVAAREEAIAQCHISMDQIEDIYPCTPLQAGMTALTGECPGAYVARHRMVLGEDVDVQRLKRAWGAVSQGNPILRTRLIQTAEMGCLQVVIRNDPLQWNTCSQDEDEGLLFGKPLVHFQTVWNPSGQCNLVVTMHHTVYDAWSLPLLVQRAQLAYFDPTNERILAAPFQDFVRFILTQQEASLGYWRDHFQGLCAEPFPQPPSPSYRPQASKTEQVSIPTGALKHTVTRSVAIQLVWAVVQSQYQCSQEVVYGMVSSGRAAPVHGIESMSGPTIATVPLRIRLNANMSVADALDDLQAHVMEMVPYEQVGLPAIASTGEEAMRACAFQTLLAISREGDSGNEDIGILKHIGASFEDKLSMTYALQLIVGMEAGTTTVEAIFDENVVPTWKMRHILAQFSHVLQLVHSQPQSSIGDIATINQHDLEQLQAWNSKTPTSVGEELVVDLIIEHCNAQPAATAVSAWDGELTYYELNRYSNRLARQLISDGIGAESLVPIYLDRSRLVPVAILAVIKADAAFVLLDTSYPSSRLRTICDEIDASVVITSTDHQTMAQTLAPRVVNVDDANERLHTIIVRCDTPNNPHNALYAVFTSGSTGKPKGAVIENSSFVAMAKANARSMRLSPMARVLHAASYAFDVSIVEVLGSLTSGACVCIPSEPDRKERLAQAAGALMPTHAYIPVSLLRALAPARLRSLHTIMTGGETVRAEDIQKWSQQVRLLTGYGPAECTITATVQPLVADSRPGNIGFPIAGAAWVTDPQNPAQPVPIGAVGELILDGPQVGRGYMNNPHHTAASFIARPAWIQSLGVNGSRSGSRVYRTGDLVHHEKDGSLCFVGRKDFQVKLRGKRFEPSEVEQHVQRVFPGGLKDLVALVVTPASAEQAACLAVFLIPPGAATASDLLPSPIPPLHVMHVTNFQDKVAQAKQHLQDVLPDYMVPAAFVPLREIPHTLGGKVDRSQLQQAVKGVTRQELESLAPNPAIKRGPTTTQEKILHQMWARLLGLSPSQIGVDESFFRLGGDSITAMQAASRAREAGVEHSVGELFRWRTIEKIARESSQRPMGIQQIQQQQVALPLVDEGERASILSKVSGDLVQNNVDDVLPTPEFQTITIINSSLVALAELFPGSVNLDRLLRACKHVIAHHSILRTIFVAHDKQVFQVVLREINPEFDRVEVDDPAAFLAEASQQEMEWTSVEGHLPLRFTAVTDRTGEHWGLIIRLSHGQFDPPSLSLLWHSIAEAYSGHVLPRSTPFKEVVYHRLGQEHPEAVSFWRHHLRNVSDPAPGFGTARRSERAAVGGGLMTVSRKVDGLLLPPDITMATLVQSAIAFVLSQHTAQSDIVLGQISHGRGHPIASHEEVLGPCSTTLPLRIGVDHTWAAVELLRHVQNQRLATVSYDSLSWEKIVSQCTDWPTETIPACMVNHHSLLERTEGTEFAGVRSKWSRTWSQAKPREGQLAVISVERGSRVEVHLKARDEVMDAATGNRWIAALKAVMVSFCLRPQTGLTEHMIDLKELA